jgi:two-component system nitrogen regulation sensor histidine kinase NtrY
MTFRSKLLVAFAATVLVAVGLDSFIVAETTRDHFERLDSRRSSALVAQFRREFERRQEEVVRRTERMAASGVLERIALEPDYAPYLDEARALAAAQVLDFVELTTPDGAIISSAQWPARFGYTDEWVARMGSSGIQTAMLKREELPEEVALALVAVRVVSVGDKSIFVAGGLKLDKDFLASIELPEGMRMLLYRNLQPAFSAQALTSASGPAADAEKFTPLIERVKRERKELTDSVAVESFQATPLFGREKELLAVRLIGSSSAEMLSLTRFIRRLGLTVGAAGVLLGLLLAWWATARITRPVHELAAAAGEVAAGNWNARVDIQSSDEIGELAAAFNQMTRHLTEQRERLVQSERVAAWRELARRLAHELKNPLFPLQITVENMRRARDQYPDQFDEVFREGSATLLAELANLKTIINRFSDFSKMPPPQLQPTNLNEIVRGVMKLVDAQLAGQRVESRMELDGELPPVEADAAQLHRALQNLVLNALDAMPSGGVLTVRTGRSDGSVRLEVADTGSGLTKEECERLFTPYYTTKQHGTGLGLAIVQSVVSDHGGRISVESEPGRGSTFRIELQNGTSSHR